MFSSRNVFLFTIKISNYQVQNLYLFRHTKTISISQNLQIVIVNLPLVVEHCNRSHTSFDPMSGVLRRRHT
jgi:hypothetical protein